MASEAYNFKYAITALLHFIKKVFSNYWSDKDLSKHSSLTKGHTEKRRARRFYIAEIVRHRGTVGAWRNRGYLRVLLEILFTKRLPHKLSGFSTQYLRRSLCLRHLREIVCFHLRPLRDSVWRFYCQTIRLAPYISVTYHSFVFNNPPSSPWLCVTLHQNSKLKRRILSLLLLKPFFVI